MGHKGATPLHYFAMPPGDRPGWLAGWLPMDSHGKLPPEEKIAPQEKNLPMALKWAMPCMRVICSLRRLCPALKTNNVYSKHEFLWVRAIFFRESGEVSFDSEKLRINEIVFKVLLDFCFVFLQIDGYSSENICCFASVAQMWYQLCHVTRSVRSWHHI